MTRIASGRIFLIAAGILLGPLAVLPFYPGEIRHAFAFLAPSLALSALGLFLSRGRRHQAAPLSIDERDGAFIVTVCWLVVTAASSWPFIAVCNLNFSQAFFESMSGWTTTGLSVIAVEQAPRIILFFRSWLQLAGGAGLAIIMLAVLPLTAGAGLYRAEGKNYQLVPNVGRSARLVLRLYAGYAIAGTIALRIAGMSLFDAVNHAFCAVSTGGFSTRAASLGFWDSAPVEAVIIALMILGNLNFLSAYMLFSGKIKTFFRNAETKLMLVVLGIFTVLAYALVTRGMSGSVAKDIRIAVFEVVSALTTTGFSTVSYAGWKGLGILLLVVLMFIGGGVCSTAGGLKQYRVYLLLKAIGWNVGRSLLPRNARILRRAWVGDTCFVADDRVLADVGVFAALYAATFAIGVGSLAACGFSLRDAVFEFASALGTVGISTGATGAASPSAALWAMSAGMFLGRLEFFVVFVAAARLAGMVRQAARTGGRRTKAGDGIDMRVDARLLR